MSLDQVIAYLAGEVDDPDGFEQRLFAGAHDGDALTELSELTSGLREAAFLGILSILVTRSEMEKLRTLGYRILDCPMRPGEVAVADLSGDFDLIFLEYDVDLTDITRLDIEVCSIEGQPFKRIEEVVLPPPGNKLSGFCARELALAGIENNPEGLLTRFLTIDDGEERVVAEFIGKSVIRPGPA